MKQLWLDHINPNLPLVIIVSLYERRGVSNHWHNDWLRGMGVFREKCDRSIAFELVLCAITCHVVPRYIESVRLSIHRSTTWHNMDSITLWNLTGRLITAPHRTPCSVSQHHPCLPRLEIIPLQPFYPNLKQFKRMSCLMGLLCLHKSQGTQKKLTNNDYIYLYFSPCDWEGSHYFWKNEHYSNIIFFKLTHWSRSKMADILQAIFF